MTKPNAILPGASQDLLPFFNVFFDSTTDIVFFKNADLVYIAASRAFAEIAGKASVEEIIGRTDAELFTDSDLAQRYVDDDLHLISTDVDMNDYAEPLPDRGGMARYGMTSKHLVKDSAGKILGIIGITRDVTQEYLERQHYQQELAYLFKLPEDAYAAVLVDVDDWRVVSQRRNDIGGNSLEQCHSITQLTYHAACSILDADCAAARFYRDFTAETLRRRYYEKGESFFSFQYERRLTGGDVRWVLNEVRFLIDPETRHLCLLLTSLDIDEKKRAEIDIYLAARMDRMTMLLNRDATTNLITNVLTNEAGSIHALFMLDVDNFKALNDVLGHQEGDEFLVRMATKLKSCFRDSDIVGRIGGDEFFVLMRNLPNLTIAKNKARQLLNVIRELCSEYSHIGLSCSIGVSAYPENGTTLNELYARADDSLYSAKRRGKNCCVSAF